MLTLAHGQLTLTNNLSPVLEALQERLSVTLASPPGTDYLIDRLARLAHELSEGTDDLPLTAIQRQAVQSFCKRETLKTRLTHELGTSQHVLRRRDYRLACFEGWYPLGLVVHIMSDNTPLLPFFSVIESLLMGNITWLCPCPQDDDLSARLLAALLAHDHEDRLLHHVAVLPVAHHHLGELIRHADGVAAWGSDTALTAARRHLSPGCRWISSKRRLSFAYVVPAAACPSDWDAIADGIGQHDLRPSNALQTVLIDSDNPEELRAAGQALAAALERRASRWPAISINEREAAEITTEIELTRLEQSFGHLPGQVWTGSSWKILWLHRPELAPSPQFRTVQLRPMPRDELTARLAPWRTRLQSCALVAPSTEFRELTHTLLKTGVTRLTAAALIHEHYPGEPHDGVYSLTCYARRVSVKPPVGTLDTHATLDDMPPAPARLRIRPLMDRTDLHAHPPGPDTQMYVQSSYSTGSPALIGFSYRDRDRQICAAADGMLAAGLDPAQDHVMHIIAGDDMWGAPSDMISILERMNVTQIPIVEPNIDDYRSIVDLIHTQGINTIIGTPNTVLRLFQHASSHLRAYGGVHKLLLVGEPISSDQFSFWRSCGISKIRSALYGSLETGPLGHACTYCPRDVFHLLADTQWLEILDESVDHPVHGSDIGRLVFTSRAREAQRIMRYDLGELGRWCAGNCPCGLPSPRFEVIGRRDVLLKTTAD
ncbi:acyl-CoA reductase [Burkholderia pyrrocinia]|uniref:acyl-CoA reductase n=1 Tax=Burkholderia pyrrocinia TaxID=60550 RepID=UPI00158D6197|nr:acyl-CoA reductase [Burkholderia pyrrocinia]